MITLRRSLHFPGRRGTAQLSTVAGFSVGPEVDKNTEVVP